MTTSNKSDSLQRPEGRGFSHASINKYAKGVRWEREVKAELEAKGYIVVRASGSHSPYDLVGVHPEWNRVVFVQCKAGRLLSKPQRELILKANRFLHSQTMQVSFELREKGRD